MSKHRQDLLTRRQVLSMGGGAIAAALVASCSGTPAAPPSPAPTAAPAPKSAPTATAVTKAAPATTAAPAAAPTTLALGYRSGNQAYFADRAKAFTQKNPSTTINLQPIGGDQAAAYYPKLAAEMAGGIAPDVFWVSTGFGTYDSYAWRKQLIHADPFIQADNIDLSQWFKAAIDTLKLDGKLYALPWGMHPDEIGLYYNQNLFEKASVAAPDIDKETYDSLAAKAVKLTDRSNPHAITWGIDTEVGAFSTGLISYVRSFGGDFMTPDKKKAAVNTPEVLAAFTWLYDIRAKQKCNPLLSQMTDNDGSFIAGRLGMFNGGVWEMTITQKIGSRFKMGLSLIPKGPTGVRGSMAHVDTISGYSQGKHLSEAFKLIVFLTDKESGVQNALYHSFWGARPDVWADPRPGQKYGKDFVAVWKTATENSMPLDEPYNFRLIELSTIMDNTLSPLWNAKTTPDEILPKLASAMNVVLSKPRS